MVVISPNYSIKAQCGSPLFFKESKMDKVQVFNFNNADVRTVERNGDVWFVAKDVADVLGYKDTAKAISTHCKGVGDLSVPSSGGEQITKIIPERDVYRLIMRSRLPEAEKFEEWVVGTVLPSIRKNGGYIANQEQLTPAEILANAIIVAQNVINEQKAKLEAQQALLIEQKPKVDFYNQVADATGSFDMREVSALLKLPYGRNKLFAKLRDNKILQDDNLPYRQYIDKEYFVVVETKWRNPKTEEVNITKQTRLTQKGLEFLQSKLTK
jgi:anti-repressor protein